MKSNPMIIPGAMNKSSGEIEAKEGVTPNSSRCECRIGPRAVLRTNNHSQLRQRIYPGFMSSSDREDEPLCQWLRSKPQKVAGNLTCNGGLVVGFEAPVVELRHDHHLWQTNQSSLSLLVNTPPRAEVVLNK